MIDKELEKKANHPADTNGDGKVSKRELVSAFERLAKLVNYSLSQTDLGQLGYLWSVMDIENEGELNYN